MTLFEYISIAASLILSFSLARTLTNLAPVFSPDRRYWVHGAWVLGMLVFHATLFWQLWVFQEVEVWTLAKFVLFLMGPILLLVGVSLLVPTDPAPDYRVYFESIRRPFYSVLIAFQIQPVPLFFLLFDVPLGFHPLFLGNLIFTGAAVVGLVARKRSVDMVLVCFFLLGVIGGIFTINDHAAIMESVRSLMR